MADPSNPLSNNPNTPGEQQSAPLRSDPGDPFKGRPSQFNQDQQKNISESLNAAIKHMREQKEAQGVNTDFMDDPSLMPPPTGEYQRGQAWDRPGRPLQEPQQPNQPPPQRHYTVEPENQESMAGYHTTREFEHLLKIGYLTRNFDINGNVIIIRSLTQKEELLAMEVASEYPDDLKPRAFFLACVAQSIESINHKKWYEQSSISEDTEKQILQGKVDALSRLYKGVIEYIISEYNEMIAELSDKAAFALKK